MPGSRNRLATIRTRLVAKELLLWGLVVGVPVGIACGVNPGELVTEESDPGDTPDEATLAISGVATPVGPPLDSGFQCLFFVSTGTEMGQPSCEKNGAPARVSPLTDPTSLNALRAAGPSLGNGTYSEGWSSEQTAGLGDSFRCEVRLESEDSYPVKDGVVCGKADDTADGNLDEGAYLLGSNTPVETANPSGATRGSKHRPHSAAVTDGSGSIVIDHSILGRVACPNGSNGFEVNIVSTDTVSISTRDFNTCNAASADDVGATAPVVILDAASTIPNCGNPSNITAIATAARHVWAILTCSDDSRTKLVGGLMPEGDPSFIAFNVMLEPDDMLAGGPVYTVGNRLDAESNGTTAAVVVSGINADTAGGDPAYILAVWVSTLFGASYTLEQVIAPGVLGLPPGYNRFNATLGKLIRAGSASDLPGDPKSPLGAPLSVTWSGALDFFGQPNALFRMWLDGSSGIETLFDETAPLPDGSGETVAGIFRLDADGGRGAARIRTSGNRFGALEFNHPSAASPVTELTSLTVDGDPAPGGGHWISTGVPLLGRGGYFFVGRLGYDDPGGLRWVIAHVMSNGDAVILRRVGEQVYPTAAFPQSLALPDNGAAIGGGPFAPGGALLTNTVWGGSGPILDVIVAAQQEIPALRLLGATAGSGANNQIFAFETPASERTDLGTPAIPAVESFATHPVTGVVYAGTGSADGGRLHTVNPDTGALTLVGNLIGVVAAYGLAFDGAGQLWGVVAVAASDQRWLAQIDETTAAVTLIGRVNHPGGSAALRLQSLAITRDGRMLAGAGFQFGATYAPLVEIDTATAEVVSVVELAGLFSEVQGLDTTADGTLVASFVDGSVYEVDSTTGAVASLGFATTYGFTALAVEDSDGDGRRDADERSAGTRTNDPDSDNDGLDDGAEQTAGTDPLDPDSDDDTLTDGFEQRFGLDPLVADDPSTDGEPDGLTLFQEQTLGGNPGASDTDGDGLNDGAEAALGTRVYRADSDGDGLGDSAESSTGTDPLDPDSDNDGIADAAELLLYPAPGGGTTALDPLNPDSDGDGVLDGADFEPAIPNAAPPSVPVLPLGALSVLAVLLAALVSGRLLRRHIAR